MDWTQASHLAVGLAAYLCVQASSLLEQTFDEIRASQDRQRHKTGTPESMKFLAFYLGRINTELAAVADAATVHPQVRSPGPFHM